MTEEEVIVQDGGMLQKPLSRGDLKEIERIEAEKEEQTTVTETPKLADTYVIEPPKSKKQVISEIKNEQADGMLKFARETLIAKEERRTIEKKPKKKRKTRQKKLEIEAPKELAKELVEPEKKIEEEERYYEDGIRILQLPELPEKFNVPLIEREIQIKASGSQLAVCSKEVEKDQKPKTKDQEQLLGPQKSYKLLQKIGQGGFGTVYEIEETTTGARKAVKIFHKEKAVKISVQKLEDKVKEINKRCDEEVVKIDHVCKDEKGLYVIMQLMKETADKYAEGKTVKERMDLFYKLLANVKKLHEHGLIHKDLKPSNVLIDKYGNPKLSDTDLAQIIEREGGVEISDVLATTTGNVVRSLYYTAPEQLSDEKVDSRADVYSLGVLLYEFVTGERFSTDWMAEMENKNYSPELIKIISKAIRKNIDSRYQNVEELRKDLEKIDLEKLIDDKKDSVEKKIADGEIIELVKDGQSIGKYKIVGLADADKVVVKQPEVDEKKEKGVKKYFWKIVNSHWNPVDYWNTVTQMAYMMDGVNKILKFHEDYLKQTGFKASAKHKEFDHKKIVDNFSSLEEAILKGYELAVFEENKYTYINATFESEKIIIAVSRGPDYGVASGINLNIKMKVPFEGNQKLYSEIKDYVEKQLKSWWRNTKHFKELEKQGYTYETARQLFLNGTFEQFARKDGADKECYGKGEVKKQQGNGNSLTNATRIEDLETNLELAIPDELVNTIEVKDGDKTVIYTGKWHNIHFTDKIKTAMGGVEIIRTNESNEGKISTAWSLTPRDSAFIIYDGKIANNPDGVHEYRKKLLDKGISEKIILTPKLLSMVFDPLDKQIMEHYNRIKKANKHLL